MSKGFEAKSLGLVKMARKNTDARFTAVEHRGNTIWALHPKYFNKDDVKTLEDRWSSDVEIDTSVFVGSIKIKGQMTHSEYETTKREFVPIVLGPNPFTGLSPTAYSQSLGSGTTSVGNAEEYAPFYLNYGVTAKSTVIDVLSLPGIEKYASGNITVTHPGGSLSVPLPSIVSGQLSGEIVINVGDTINNGFIYDGTFGDVVFTGEYKREFRQYRILSNYQTHMLQNRTREETFEDSDAFASVMMAIGGAVINFDFLGGVNSVLDALYSYGLRDAQFTDMKRQLTDLGGDLVTNMVGFEADTLITVDYPTSKYVIVNDTSNPSTERLRKVKLSDYTQNKSHTYEINGLYPDMNTALEDINETYKGELIGGDIKPVIDYGDYSKYFSQIISRGGLI